MSTILGSGLLRAAGSSTLQKSAPATVLVPMLNMGVANDMLQLAAICATGLGARQDASDTKPHIVVLSVVEVPVGQPLTMGLDMARSYRALLDFLPSEIELGGRRVRVDRVVKVARDVPSAVRQAVYEEDAGMVLFYWKGYARDHKRHHFGSTLDIILKKPPCDVAITRPERWRESKRVLLPVRGGPSAEQALDLAVLLAGEAGLSVTVIHNVAGSPEKHVESGQSNTLGDEPYAIFAHHLEDVKASSSVQITSVLTIEGDTAPALLKEASSEDFIIMGMAPLDTDAQGVMPVPLQVASEKGPPVLLLRSAGVVDLSEYTRDARSRRGRKDATDMPSERWFVENTYHGDEFKDPEEFLKLKQASGLSLSVALLTFNDTERIYSLITGLKRVLTQMHSIADQIVVVDAGSNDDTADIARSLGVEVYQAEGILPERGALYGRGESWWKSLAVLRGDVLVWLDPRARKFHPSCAMSLAGPLLRVPSLQLVKAFSQTTVPHGRKAAEKPSDAHADEIEWGGSMMPHREEGAITGHIKVQGLAPEYLLALDAHALATLPPDTILKALSPSLAGLISPFGRDIAGRRDAMQRMPAMTGDNFEAGLLLSVAAEYGARAIAQVELRHSLPTQAPQPMLRNAIDVLQVLSMRLPDSRMKQIALELAHKLGDGGRGNGGSAVMGDEASATEVRALGPVERPAMGG